MKEQIKARTKRIGVTVISLVDELPQKTAAFILAKQIIRVPLQSGQIIVLPAGPNQLRIL